MTSLPAPPKKSLDPLIVRGPFQQSLGSARDFKRDDNRPLQNRPVTRCHPRFGNYSHHSFFARHVACPKRVRHMKGLNDQPICCVVDEGFDNPKPTQSMPSFPNSFADAKMTQYDLPVHNRLSGDALSTLLGSMFAKVRPSGFIKERALPPMGRWNTFGIVPDTGSWRHDLRDMLRALGLSQSLQVSTLPGVADKQGVVRPATQQGRPTTRDIARPPNSLEHIISERDSEVLVFQLLCQILQTDNPQEVQIWLRSSSPREKQLVLNLVRVALESMQEETLPPIEEGADVDVRELNKEIEKLSLQVVQPVDRSAERPQSRFVRNPAPSRQEPRKLEPLVEKVEKPEQVEKLRPRTSQVAQPFQSPQPARVGSQPQSDAGTQTDRDVVVRLKYSEPRRESVLLTAEYLRDKTWAPSNSVIN